MSNLVAKRRSVMASGEARRRNWNPDPESAHYKLYMWWAYEKRYSTVKENFCHYWRVVFIWAPLLAIGRFFTNTKVVVTTAVLVGLALLAVLIFALQAQELIALGVGVYLSFGVITALSLAGWYNSAKRRHKKREATLRGVLCTILAAPFLVPIAVVIAVLFAVVMPFVLMQKRFKLYSKTGKWLVSAHPSERKMFVWMRPILLAPVAITVLAFQYRWAAVLLEIAIVAVGVVAIVVLASWLADYWRSRPRPVVLRSTKPDFSYAQIVDALYRLQHDGTAYNKGGFNAWLVRFDRRLSTHALSRADIENSLWSLDVVVGFHTVNRLMSMLYDDHHWRRALAIKKRRSRKVVKITRAAVDILALVWAVILTRKWQICPRVIV